MNTCFVCGKENVTTELCNECLLGGMKMSNVTITEDQIRTIIAESEIKTYKFGNKTTVVHAVLPNGFVMVESSSCVDPENFDEVIGYDICMNRIANKIWELEGYALQKKVTEDDKA